MAPAVEQIPQHEAVQSQDGARRFDVSDRPFQFAVIPQVCTFAQVAELLAVSERGANRREPERRSVRLSAGLERKRLRKL